MQELLEFAEELEQNFELEPELESGVLSIIMPDEREYIINKHTPSRQIWVSSPYSGAAYFEYQGGEWRPKRAPSANGRALIQFIRDEIRTQLGMEIE